MCRNLTKGYWMKNNQNGGGKWNEIVYISKIQYSPMARRWQTTASGDYLVNILPPHNSV